jgi:hypothetical protein
MASADFEKLGSFYLGKAYDPDARRRTDDLVLYDSKDMVTHAVCVGMTGSGKTGLCLGVLEEAIIDGIPAIVIDPKGDLSNLLLTFPQLRPEDFRPWINTDDASKKGLDPDAFAAQQAATWAKGIAEWGQDAARIQRLRDAADVAIYTPGSSAGLAVSVLRSFDAPPPEIIEDGELFRERVSSTSTSLLGLVGLQVDPLQSREHILMSAILGDAWAAGRNVDIPGLIQLIQTPPFTKLGVMELESVFPAKERFGLAMTLNNLVASPGFGAWTTGEPLDIGAMLFTKQGKPRVSIFSIAHLGDAERMFFVSLLMNQILGWTRQQSGTTSLRALVYMDEIAGYFPPTANPPSKQPMLTMMKQARAFGVGMMLATQNPVDLDYKGLANAGTWFIGRLQTERDKLRVLDGLEGAAAGASASFDRAAVDRLLSQLGPRVFLMNNVHDNEPVVFESRWCLSYLRGPLTRQQIKTLMDARRSDERPGAPATPSPPTAAAPRPSPSATQRPVLPPEVPQYFLPARAGGTVTYVPMLLGLAKVYFQDAKLGIDEDVQTSLLASIGVGPVPVDWDHAEEVAFTEKDVEHEPAQGAAFATLPVEAGKAKSYDAWKKSLGDALYRSRTLELMRCASLDETSKPGEREREFRARLAQVAREARDAQAEKLRTRYAPKLQTLQDRLRRAQQALEVQKEQSSSAKLGTAISFGAAILGAFMGRKVASAGSIGKAATAARSVSRASKESADVGRATESVEAVQAQLAALEAQFQEELAATATRIDPTTEELETLVIKPKKTNIQVRAVVLAWAPHTADAGGALTPAW